MEIPNNKILIIIGAAPCAQDDKNATLKLLNLAGCKADFMAIGLDAINCSKSIKYLATYHPGDIIEARKRRADAGLNTDYEVISHIQHQGSVQMILPCEKPSGSSALLGVLAGIKLGYEKIIVCGCPLEGKNTKNFDYANFQKGWTAKLAEIKEKTRSMSGWTGALLGAPVKEWLVPLEITGLQADQISNGINGAGYTSQKINNTLIIIGSAPCAQEDVTAALSLRDASQAAWQSFDFMAIGLDAVGLFSLPLKYVATNHPEDIPDIRKRREMINANLDYQIISYREHKGVDIVQHVGSISGSSALLGALAGITLGYKKIILCGCPLTGPAVTPKCNPYEIFRPGWEAEKEKVMGKVKSMSGWTKDFLGEPTEERLKNKITVAACWDGRAYYPPEYVNILYNSVARNTTIPFDFVLYIGPEAETKRNLINPDIKIVQTGLPYWWSGMKFWQNGAPGVNPECLLYLDLDQVIVGNLDDLINFPADLVCMKDYPYFLCPAGAENDANVAVSLIRNGAGARVWDEYVKAGMPQWDPLDPKCAKPLRMAAQGIIKDFEIKKDLFPENWVCSYKLQVVHYGLPEDCRIVSFHGVPKPHQCLTIPWVKENWR